MNHAGGGLTSDLARLDDAYRQLMLKWERVREQWRDRNAEAVEEQYLQPLQQILATTLPAIGQMNDELGTAIRTCSEPREML